MHGVAVSYTHAALTSAAEQLAQQLQLPIFSLSAEQEKFPFRLVLTPEALTFCNMDQKFGGPIQVNFTSGKLNYRRKHLQQEILRKALKFRPQLTVIDATAGLGNDAFLMAALGCKVLMLERSPILAALLQDGLQRLQKVATILGTLHIQQVDAIHYLEALTPELYPQVIYLDPMFPLRDEKALSKKEARYLRAIVGMDADLEDLFQMALLRAQERVVVKRPWNAETITDLKPTVQYQGKQIRFDVYVKNRVKVQN